MNLAVNFVRNTLAPRIAFRSPQFARSQQHTLVALPCVAFKPLHGVHVSRMSGTAHQEKFHAAIAELENIIGEDIGKRGIGAIKLSGQLSAAACAFLDARAVVVLTGFPCRMNDVPPTETDGPPGAIALAMAALKLGKPTAIATDVSSSSVMMRCATAAGLPSMGDFALYSFPPKSEWSDDDTARLQSVIAEYDHAVAIERAGRAADGSYYTMRALKMDHLVAPIDELLTADCLCGVTAENNAARNKSTEAAISDTSEVFELHGKVCQSTGIQTDALPELAPLVFSASGAELSESVSPRGRSLSSPPLSSPRRSLPLLPSPRRSRVESSASLAAQRTSTGIGDGGNECGMGKVFEAVKEHIPRGDTIACAIPADNLITAGVSNWGGWGLCAAVEALIRTRLLENPQEEASVESSMLRVWRRPSQGCIDFTLRFLVSGQEPGFLLPSGEVENAIAHAMISAGARDGITGALDGSVDGMPLDTHLSVLSKLRTVVSTHFK